MPEPILPEPILEVRGLRRSYENGRIQALRGVDLTIAAGEFVAISGASGSGKSTLLQLLGGLDSPTEGEVLLHNEPLGKAVPLDTYRAEHVGFIFQAFYLLPTLNALENVQVPMLCRPKNGTGNIKRAQDLLVAMGIEYCARQYPNQLSAGERQRVAIARALANGPDILLADEPTGNLDSENSARIMDVLKTLHSERAMTMVIVTHENEIAQAAPRHVRMRDGRIL
ncbi:MAG TPA: ABC transporter ATP-binding protein [Terracidiphilus sp.]|jgi:putative ABC transport system ATP-binding protein|nr:ABC transporter ATP-binding protein [Terracidiphilus sp.]